VSRRYAFVVINARTIDMTTTIKTWPPISRRYLFASAMRACGAATVLATAATQSAQAAKASQKIVKYQETPKGSQMCNNCKLFVAPNACQTVDGAISPNGWCIVYQRA
jgi:hypothetical protein